MTNQKKGLIIAGLIAGIGVLGSPSVAAQKEEKAAGAKTKTAKTVKPDTMTCEEFLVLGKEVQPKVVYWIEGYSESGTLKETGVVIEALERPITAVVEECKKSPKDTVALKIKAVF